MDNDFHTMIGREITFSSEKEIFWHRQKIAPRKLNKEKKEEEDDLDKKEEENQQEQEQEAEPEQEQEQNEIKDDAE